MFALPHLKPAWTEELLHHILEGDVATGGLQFDLRVLLCIVLLLILPFLIIIAPLYGVIPHHREVLQVPGHGSGSSRHPLPARPELSVTSPGMQNLPFQHHERDKSVMLRSENKACGREIATRCCRLLCITAHSTAWAPTTLPGLHALLNSEALPQQVASKRTKTSATGEKRQPLLRPILAAHPEPLSPAPPGPSHPKQQLWLPFLHITPSSSPNPWMWLDIRQDWGGALSAPAFPFRSPSSSRQLGETAQPTNPTENPLLMPVHNYIPSPSIPGQEPSMGRRSKLPSCRATTHRVQSRHCGTGQHNPTPTSPPLWHQTAATAFPTRGQDPKEDQRPPNTFTLGPGWEAVARPRRPTAPHRPRSPGTVRVPPPLLPSRCSGAPSLAPPLPAGGGPTAPARPHRAPPARSPAPFVLTFSVFAAVSPPQFGPDGRPWAEAAGRGYTEWMLTFCLFS